MIVDKINAYLSSKSLTIDEALRYEVEKLAGFSFKRQFMTNDEDASKGKLRLSGCGKCPRQLSYAFHGIEKKGKEIDSRGKIVFFMGDLSELMLTSLARLSGVNIIATGLNQARVFVKINGTEVEGHPDGIVIENNEMLLAEFKSMTSYGYDRFEQGEVDDGYLAQMNLYMHGLGLNKCVMVALNKDSGVIGEKVISVNRDIVNASLLNMQTVLSSTEDKLPAPKYTTDAKGFYPWQCLYCSFWGHCRPNAERVLAGRSYKLKEKNGNPRNT